MVSLGFDVSEAGVARKLPTEMPQQRMATGNDFGAQSGEALQQLGNSISSFGARVAANKKQLDTFNTDASRIKLEGQIQDENIKNARNISGDGEGFMAGQATDASKRYDELIAGTKDPTLQSELKVKKEEFLKSFNFQNLKLQYAQQDTHTGNVLDEHARTAGLQVQSDPNVLPQLLKQHQDLIEKSTLSPEDKIKRIAMDSANMAYTAELARAKNNPQSVIAGGDRAQAGLNYFMSQGWTREQAAGIMGNLLHESKLNTSIAGDRRIGQWNRERLQNLKNFAAAKGTAFTDYQTQLEFVQHELQTSESGAADALRSAKTVDQATAAAIGFERPRGWTPDNPQGGMGFVSRREYARQVAGGGSGGVTDAGAARQYLTPQQNAQVQETAESQIAANLQQEQQAQKVQHDADMNALLTNLTHGDNPQASYAAAWSSGLLVDHDDDSKALATIKAREDAGKDLAVGNAIMHGGGVYNQFDEDQKKGLNAWYSAGLKAGMPGPDLMQAALSTTGSIPTDAFTGIRSGVNSADPKIRTASLTTAANMLDNNPNVFAGQDGSSDVEAQVAKFKGRVSLGDSSDQAVQNIMAQEKEDKANPVRAEQVDQFVKDQLTEQNITTTVKSLLGGWTGTANMPTNGAQVSAINGIFSEMAKDGYRRTGTPDGALAYAKAEFKKQFGVQAGVITRYPPSNANLPSGSKFAGLKVEGAGDGYAWINQQAADLLNKQNPELKVDPSQIVLVPIQSNGYSTRTAWSGHPDTVYRNPGSGDGKQAPSGAFQSIPYRLMVVPKDENQSAYPPFNGVFYPDPESYVKGATAASAANDKANPVPLGAGGQDASVHYPKPAYRTMDEVKADTVAKAEALHAASVAQRKEYDAQFAKARKMARNPAPIGQDDIPTPEDALNAGGGAVPRAPVAADANDNKAQ